MSLSLNKLNEGRRGVEWYLGDEGVSEALVTL